MPSVPSVDVNAIPHCRVNPHLADPTVTSEAASLHLSYSDAHEGSRNSVYPFCVMIYGEQPSCVRFMSLKCFCTAPPSYDCRGSEDGNLDESARTT